MKCYRLDTKCGVEDFDFENQRFLLFIGGYYLPFTCKNKGEESEIFQEVSCNGFLHLQLDAYFCKRSFVRGEIVGMGNKRHGAVSFEEASHMNYLNANFQTTTITTDGIYE